MFLIYILHVILLTCHDTFAMMKRFAAAESRQASRVAAGELGMTAGKAIEFAGQNAQTEALRAAKLAAQRTSTLAEQQQLLPTIHKSQLKPVFESLHPQHVPIIDETQLQLVTQRHILKALPNMDPTHIKIALQQSPELLQRLQANVHIVEQAHAQGNLPEDQALVQKARQAWQQNIEQLKRLVAEPTEQSIPLEAVKQPASPSAIQEAFKQPFVNIVQEMEKQALKLAQKQKKQNEKEEQAARKIQRQIRQHQQKQHEKIKTKKEKVKEQTEDVKPKQPSAPKSIIAKATRLVAGYKKTEEDEPVITQEEKDTQKEQEEKLIALLKEEEEKKLTATKFEKEELEEEIEEVEQFLTERTLKKQRDEYQRMYATQKEKQKQKEEQSREQRVKSVQSGALTQQQVSQPQPQPQPQSQSHDKKYYEKTIELAHKQPTIAPLEVPTASYSYTSESPSPAPDHPTLKESGTTTTQEKQTSKSDVYDQKPIEQVQEQPPTASSDTQALTHSHVLEKFDSKVDDLSAKLFEDSFPTESETNETQAEESLENISEKEVEQNKNKKKRHRSHKEKPEIQEKKWDFSTPEEEKKNPNQAIIDALLELVKTLYILQNAVDATILTQKTKEAMKIQHEKEPIIISLHGHEFVESHQPSIHLGEQALETEITKAMQQAEHQERQICIKRDGKEFCRTVYE